MTRISLIRRGLPLVGASILLSWMGVAPAKAATLQVGAGGYATIQLAINAAANGDTIVLADGTYSGAGNWLVTVNKTVTIKSANGAAACVVDFGGTFNSGLSLLPGTQAGTIQIEGITFRNGQGVALYNFYSTVNATFRVLNCVFEGFSNPNFATVIQDSFSGVNTGHTEIVGCVFRNNSKRCVFAIGASNLRDCVFEGNAFIPTGYAAGICFVGADAGSTDMVRVENCRFLNNTTGSTNSSYYGYGSLVVQGPTPEVLQCEFRGNSSNYYAAAYILSLSPLSGRLEHCVFADNSASMDGGALYTGSYLNSSITVSNCLFTNNQAGRYYGAVNGYSRYLDCTFVANSAGVLGGGGGNFNSVNNCIFWGNAAPSHSQIYGAATVSHSIVQGGYAGISILNVDPQFVDAPNKNYRLLATSPARDSGFSYGYASVDLDGNPRIVNGIVDRGAYEFQGTNTLPTVSSSASTFELECDCGPSCTETHVAFNYSDGDGDGLVAHWKIDNGPELTSNIAADGPPNAGTFTVTAHLGLGTHTIHFWVSDGEGSSDVAEVTVTVRDTTAATIAVPSGTVTLECHVDTFDPMAGVSATDACAGDLTSAIVVENPVNTLVPGVYTVTYSVTDPSGNTSSATREVVVQDNTPPEITMTGDPFVTIYCGAGWTDPGAAALDLCDGMVSVSVDSNVNPNMIGLYSVTYTATDTAGNSNSTTRYVRVIATVVGLENPMGALALDGTGDPSLPEHAFKRGRTLPLKLKLLCGSTPLGVNDVDPPKIVSLVRVGDAENLTVLDLNSGESNDNGPDFRWSDPHWIYNLSTKELSVGTYHITIEMPDGMRYVAAFVLK